MSTKYICSKGPAIKPYEKVKLTQKISKLINKLTKDLNQHFTKEDI